MSVLDEIEKNCIVDAVASGEIEVLVAALGRCPHLIDVGYDGHNSTPMHYAAHFGQAAVVETLQWLGSRSLDRRDSNSYTPMHVAAQTGRVHIVETLHRLGSKALRQATRQGWTPAHVAAFGGHVHVIETLHRLDSEALNLRDKDDETPMHAAIRAGPTGAAVVAALLRLGVTPPHTQLLELACYSGNSAAAELLFAAGADALALADDWPDQVDALLTMPVARLLALREQMFFSSTLLDLLIDELN